MTRRDYELIASVLAQAWRQAAGMEVADGAYGRLDTVRLVAHGLAEELAAENPRFDRGRFLAAAMPQK